jgi:Fe-S-cluster containining protein
MTSNNSSSVLFECIQCGECCNGIGGTYVDDNKIKEIADFLKISKNELKEKYLILSSENRYMIACGSNNKCIFFKENCTIHPVKPRMCREWPFIPAVVKEPENWEYMSQACPGINNKADITEVKKTTVESLKNTRPEKELKKIF